MAMETNIYKQAVRGKMKVARWRARHPFNKDTKMAGEDWLANFMKKHKFSVRKPEATSIARAMGFNKPSVDRFFNIVRELREKYKFPASSIFNADESGLSTVPNKLPMVISLRGSRRVSKIVTAERGKNVTIICCISATGFYLPPFLIFARKRMLPELVERAPPGTAGHCSDNGWSNEGTFSSFLKHFYLHVKPNKESPALLILDNHKSHITLEAILYCREKNIIMVGLPPHTSHRLQPLDVSFFGPLKTYYSQACDNFMVTHPGQAITDKNIGELLSTAYFKAATVGNAVNGFKECGIEPYNPLVFSEHDFAAAKTTDHDVVSDEKENNSASPQTLVVENQQINPIEEPEDIENAESDAPKMPVSVFDFKPLPKAKQCEKKRKSKKMNSSILTSTPVKDMLEQSKKQKEEQERLKKQRKEAREAKKGVKRLKLSSCRPQSKKSRPNSPVASTSKNGFTRCPACEEEYCDPPTEDWIQCSKCQEWWHEECSNYESGIFICDLC